MLPPPSAEFMHACRKDTKAEAIKAAEREYELQQERETREHWQQLSGAEFEAELAVLFRKLGYQAEVTQTTGDEGIDILLEKGGKKVIVQCKRYSKPVGVSVARELYGTLMASDASEGILACTGGVTSGVVDFISDKPLRVMDLPDIIELSKTVEYDDAKS